MGEASKGSRVSLREVFVSSDRGNKRERMVKRLKIWVEREKRTSVQRVEKFLFWGSVLFIPVGKMTICLCRDAVHGSFCLNLFVCRRRGCGYKEKDERDVGMEIPAVVWTRL